MATLEKIRRRAGVLVMVIIGLAMFGFILGDLNLRPSTKVAEINGKTFGIEEYRAEQQILLNFYKMNYGENLDPMMEQQVEDETWRRMVRSNVMEKSYKQLGLDVSTDELKAMVTGGDNGEPHPVVRQMFTNPETGEFNSYFMMNYFNSLDQEAYAQEKARWMFIENEIVDEKIQQKYLLLLSKGLAPSSLDVKDYYTENGKKVDFNFIAQNFADVADEEVEIKQSDLEAYYNEHKESFKSKASRAIEYVVFEVVASENDDANSELWAKQTKAEFGRIKNENLINYVNGISDEPFDTRFYGNSDISDLLKDSLLSQEDGAIFGPYFENDAYKLSRVYHTESRSDSVRARHILIGYAEVGDAAVAESIADSLKTEIENGADFIEIARTYSSDQSNAAIGGDLGWFKEGQMETAFNDACFENKVGDIVKTNTRYGVHIIKIEQQSRPVMKKQLATIVHMVYPSNETDQDFYNRAVKFRAKATNQEKFEEQAREYGLDPRVVPAIAKDQRTITGLESPVQIIGWAYNAEEGDVSNIFEISDNYIVATLTEVKEEGHESLKDVESQVRLEVLKQKKAEKLMEKIEAEITNGSDMNQLAESLNTSLGEANQVQFANTYVTGIGMEPYIVGATMQLPLETVSGPYKGENSVYVVNVVNRDEAALEGDMSASEDRLKYAMQSRSNYEAYNAMLEEAKVVDRRLELFYGN